MFADLAERVWKLVSKNGHPKYKRTVIELAWKRSDATRELELKAHLNSQTYSCAGTPSDNRNSKNVQAQLRDKDSQVRVSRVSSRAAGTLCPCAKGA